MKAIVAAFLAGISVTGGIALGDEGGAKARVFRAGAAAVDVSPTTFPVKVNGGFLEAQAVKVRDPLYSRALVLDDGAGRVALAVVDSCMIPRDLLDRAKSLAQKATGLPTDRILISATHTHTAPSTMGSLGCPADPVYIATLPEKIAESLTKAVQNLRPAKIGWASVDDPDNTHCRRWIRRPDKPVTDPFGLPSARAHMHPGYQNPDAISPSGAVDPELSVVAVQTPDGKPVALLANYSMHYFGTEPVSADYFGRFARTIGEAIGVRGGDLPFVGIMSQGTSGDQHWMDYSAPQTKTTIDEYAASVVRSAVKAYGAVRYHDWVPLAMAETTLRLKRRVPDAARLVWARKVVAEMGDRTPRNLPEVYAKEAIFLHDDPERELKLQAVRIGDLGIAAIPNEVFGLTGLKVKARSPLKSTFTIELANGAEGYIPPPEQHALGGYTTWPARTAALEVQAEPKIVEAVVGLLETVAGKPARKVEAAKTPYAEAVLAAKPWAFWRLEEMQGGRAEDATGQDRTAELRNGFALFLEGPATAADRPGRSVNHAVHLVGGSLAAQGVKTGPAKTYVLAFWNGLPADARAVTGTLLGQAGKEGRVGIGGTGGSKGRLFVTTDESGRHLSGRSDLAVKRWYHLAVVVDGRRVVAYLDGRPEVEGELSGAEPDGETLLIGGDPAEPAATFEGKVDEVAVFDRALTADQVSSLYDAFRK